MSKKEVRQFAQALVVTKEMIMHSEDPIDFVVGEVTRSMKKKIKEDLKEQGLSLSDHEPWIFKVYLPVIKLK